MSSPVMNSISRNPGSFAVIGAGLAGLTAARRLAEYGTAAKLFDKGRRPGGRMSTRRVSDLRFDHGAQYFTARDIRFADTVAAWSREGVVELWRESIHGVDNGSVVELAGAEQRYVGVPDMDTVISFLAAACDVTFSTRASTLRRDHGRWAIVAEDNRELGRYDTVLFALPPAQALSIIGPRVNLAEPLGSVRMSPCWAVMAAFAGSVGFPFAGAFVRSSPLSWIARNSAKPQRSAAECWVLHASSEWSHTHLDSAPDRVLRELLDAFFLATGASVAAPVFAAAHRWKYARVEKPLGKDSLWDPDLKIGICGDWCLGPRVEEAFLSGYALADRVLGLSESASL